MEGELKRGQGRGNHGHFRFEEEGVCTTILTRAILHDSQPLWRVRVQLSYAGPLIAKINLVLWGMVTHSDADLSLYKANRNSVDFAFKQREVFVAIITRAHYRNDHIPFQVLPRWVSIWVLESIKATQLGQAAYTSWYTTKTTALKFLYLTRKLRLFSNK